MEEHGGKDVIEALGRERKPRGVTLNNLDLGEVPARGYGVVDHLGILVHADHAEVEADSPRPCHQGASGVRPPAAYVQESETTTPVRFQQLSQGGK